MNRSEGKDTEIETVEHTRRELLKTAGRFAAYTPPAMMVLMVPSPTTFAQSGGGNGGRSSGSSGHMRHIPRERR
jgi:hypothetical protein